jgi:hypothetical protein
VEEALGGSGGVVIPRAALLGLLALAALPALACSSGQPPTALALAARPTTPPRFQRMERMVRAGLADASRGDARALRARSPDLTNEGMALIKAVLPHDVSRTDVPRYLEGRAAFGASLKRWVGAVETGSDEDVFAAIRDLDGATQGWIDAYLGLAPETSI